MLTFFLLTSKLQGQGFMVGVNINPISGLPSGFPVSIFWFVFSVMAIVKGRIS